MSYRPSAGDTPIITNYTPRGRPVLATFGALLVLGGAVLWGLASQGTITLPKLTDVPGAGAILGTATPSVAPQGTAPVAFTAYRDPQHHFALFISSTWHAAAATVPLGGQTLVATNFTPNGSSLPNWRIAFPSTALPTDSLSAITTVSGIFTAEGAKNVTPVSGPQSVQIGNDVWTRLDMTLQSAKGVEVHASVYSRPTAKGSVLIVAEEQTLTFTTTEREDFTPMLASLRVQI
jgi:hypothetical protein